MNMAIAGLAAAISVVGLLCSFIRPVWTFYIFMAMAPFGNLIAAYVGAAGNLGMPRTWTPADLLAWPLLWGALLIGRPASVSSNVIRKSMIAIAILSGLSLVQGLIIYFTTALTFSRLLHFVPAMLFGMRYFSDQRRVRSFVLLCEVVLVLMFVVHILVRFGIYVPPLLQEDAITGQFGGVRGNAEITVVLYFLMISLGIARLVSKTSFIGYSLLLLSAGVSGILMAETRSMYGSLAILIAASIVLIRGRVRMIVVYALAGVAAVMAVGALGFDPFSRFRSHAGRGSIEMPTFPDVSDWRGREYFAIIESYRQEPLFILTGRGIGALHRAPAARTDYAGFYHSEYLGWLDRCGIIGLTAALIMWLAAIKSSFGLSRDAPAMAQFIGVACFLLLVSVMADGVFHPIFSNPRGAPMLICFVTIIANRHEIKWSLENDAWSGLEAWSLR